jgi:hypothetical protein
VSVSFTRKNGELGLQPTILNSPAVQQNVWRVKTW